MRLKEYLKKELAQRIERNPSYSLRGMAKNLQIEPSSLSKLINGKRPFSQQMIIRLCDALKLPEAQTMKFISLEESKPDIPINQVEREYKFVHLEVDTGAWYHFAILELMNLSFFKHEIDWVANTLELSREQAQIAIKRLQMVNLLREENGILLFQLTR